MIFNGNGHTITGLTTQTGVRGAQQDSRPGDGQNSYSDAAFIGYNCCDLTLENLTFASARIAISQPWEEITQIYGSSMLGRGGGPPEWRQPDAAECGGPRGQRPGHAEGPPPWWAIWRATPR